MTGPQLSTAFFLQMLCILAACRLVGSVASRLGQPQAVGEMIAGVLMGPSLLGVLFPAFQHQLFPQESLKFLYIAAQLGIGLYMFLVGLEFDTRLFMSQARSAVSISAAGMAVPFTLGAGLALALVGKPGLFSDRATAVESMLFLGAAMSITAFPMLARIIYERGLEGSALGTLALAAGAMGDAGAWGVLAVVLASFGDGKLAAARTIGGGVLFGLVTLTVVRKLAARLGPAAERAGAVTSPLLAVTLMLFLLAAWLAAAIGIHPVLGGFLLGVMMPRGLFAREIRRQIEPLAVAFLLPMFFTFSGLNTRLDLLITPQMSLIALAIVATACIGKGGACWAAARLSGADHRTALALGSLMNARGLMELILINIGLERGIIQPALFSILALMAIATTLMAAPLFEWVYGRHARKTGAFEAEPAKI